MGRGLVHLWLRQRELWRSDDEGGPINCLARQATGEQEDDPALLTPALGSRPAPDATDPILRCTTQSFISHKLEPRVARVRHNHVVGELLRIGAIVLPVGNSRRWRTRQSWGREREEGPAAPACQSFPGRRHQRCCWPVPALTRAASPFRRLLPSFSQIHTRFSI